MLDVGLNSQIITQQEYNDVHPEYKEVGRFYCNFKVHKNCNHIPPVRPINSGSGSITENITLFVNHHIIFFFYPLQIYYHIKLLCTYIQMHSN